VSLHTREALNSLRAEALARGWDPDEMTMAYWAAVVEALFDSSKTVWVVPLERAPETLREHATTLERHLARGELPSERGRP
jgi:hypothetical protein